MAFSRVLIPLDGSELSRHGVGLLSAVQPEQVAITLLQVVPESEAVHDAEQYLQGVADSCQGEVSVLVRQSDDPAEQILEEVDQGQFDLVVLMTHGRSGLKRWVWGSVAEHVVRHCPVPLLLGTPKGEGVERPTTRKILVPLDGSALADSVLEHVQALGGSLGAEIVLFSAVWVEPTDNPLAYSRDLDVLSARAKDMLESREAALAKEGLQASSVSKRGEAASLILEAAAESGADLIAMTTHGRTGVKRWLLGSVAERVLRASPLPVLLVRTRGE
jgi:nucleotide-binding universal stress UspA family protein